MGWGTGPWGASWGSTPGGEPGVTAWDMLFGRQQGRVKPSAVSAFEGDYVVALGSDGTIPEHLTDLAVGDYIEIEQTADFDTEEFVSLNVAVRAPASLAVGTTGWTISLRIDGAVRASRTFVANEEFDMTLSANVSALAGNHSLALRLELV